MTSSGQLARSKQRTGEYNAARDTLLRALSKAPNSAPLLDAFGSVAQDLGQCLEAERFYKYHGRGRISGSLPPVAVEVEPEMKTPIMAATWTTIGAGLCAGQSATAQKATVTVCMETNQEILMGVRPLASTMFARIGLRIDWHEIDSCPAGASAIHVRLSCGATQVYGASSHALAFAQLIEGTIVVFLDRVQALKRNGERSVMAHVLVHEITHVLEGLERHSTTGIMKAHWDDRDFGEMRSKPLAFARKMSP